MTVTPPHKVQRRRDNDLSKMAPTPALWALLRWTCSPVASRIPSLIPIERCENDAIRSSFQPAAEMGWGGEEGVRRGMKNKQCRLKFTQHLGKMNLTTRGGIPMNQLSCAVTACSSLRRRHREGGWFAETFESCFGKRQACKRDELRLPSR